MADDEQHVEHEAADAEGQAKTGDLLFRKPNITLAPFGCSGSGRAVAHQITVSVPAGVTQQGNHARSARSARTQAQQGEAHDQRGPHGHRRWVGQHHLPAGQYSLHQVTRRSSSNGMDTTLEANIGAARRRPVPAKLKQVTVGASTRHLHKVHRPWTGYGASNVMSAAEVSTQPVPASASNRPNAPAPVAHRVRTRPACARWSTCEPDDRLGRFAAFQGATG